MNLRLAKEAVQEARARFLSLPSDVNELAVENAERELRRQARYEEARELEIKQAREAQRAEQRKLASIRREELRELHAKQVTALRARLEAFIRLYEALNALVEQVDSDVQADFVLCSEFAGLQVTSGEFDALEPLKGDVIRGVIGLELARCWDDSASPLHLWLAPAVPPAWNDTSANAPIARAAAKLLAQLKENDHE